MFREYCKHLVVRTALERGFVRARSLLSLAQDLDTPELLPLHAEDALLEEAYARVLGPSSNCVDVGAHLGFQLSRYLHYAPQGRHAAFEPVPRKATWLRRKFPEVTIHQAAVGNAPGTSSFFIDGQASAYSGLSRGREQVATLEEIKVQLLRLDDVFAHAHVDLLKIDVEGYELAALQGAADVLARCRPFVVFESTQSGLDAAGYTPGDLHAYLEAQGYAIFLVADFLHDAEPLARGAFERCHRYPFRAFNFLAVPLERIGQAPRRQPRDAA